MQSDVRVAARLCKGVAPSCCLRNFRQSTTPSEPPCTTSAASSLQIKSEALQNWKVETCSPTIFSKHSSVAALRPAARVEAFTLSKLVAFDLQETLDPTFHAPATLYLPSLRIQSLFATIQTRTLHSILLEDRELRRCLRQLGDEHNTTFHRLRRNSPTAIRMQTRKRWSQKRSWKRTTR